MSDRRVLPNPKLKVEDRLLDADQAAFFYRAHYVLAVAREACSDKLEAHERAKYEEAMNHLLWFRPGYISPKFKKHFKAMGKAEFLNKDAAEKLYQAWRTALKLPDDDLSRSIATKVSQYTSSLAAYDPRCARDGNTEDWATVAGWGLLENMGLRDPKATKATTITEDQRLEMLTDTKDGKTPEDWDGGTFVRPLGKLFPRFSEECFREVGSYTLSHQGKAPNGYIPTAGLRSLVAYHRAINAERDPDEVEFPVWQREVKVYELQPPVYIAGQSKDEYRKIVDVYLQAVDYVAHLDGHTIQGQQKDDLERDMRWLAWAAIEGLSMEAIATRDDPTGERAANRQTVHASLVVNNHRPGVARLSQVKLRDVNSKTRKQN
jgi:hypothetical protein